ncbi:hypothetical protein Droror1_Dr00012999 [Drosera rotundifolia]
MDFQSMKRRELQALCKRNKIPANMTNLAMANALQALPIVEGLEEFLEQRETDMTESPEKSAVTTPIVLRSSTRQRNATVTKQEPGSSKPPCRGSSRRIAGGETGREKKGASSKTEVVAPGSVTKEKGVEMRVSSSRWSTRLLDRKMKELSLDEKAVLQREFEENLQDTESSGCDSKGEIGTSLVSVVSKEASRGKLSSLAEQDKELQVYAPENEVGGLEVNSRSLEVADSSLEDVHNIADVRNNDGAEDANREIMCKSKLFVHPEEDALMLFSKLDVMLKSKEEQEVVVNKGKNDLHVACGDETEDADTENGCKMGEELLHEPNVSLDVIHEAITEEKECICKVAITCDKFGGENQKGTADAIEDGTYSEKLEDDGIKVNEDAVPMKDQEDATVAVVTAAYEHSQPTGFQKNDTAEEDCSSDVTDDFGVKASVDHDDILKAVEEVGNGLKAIKVEYSTSVVTEEIDGENSVKDGDVSNDEEEVESALKANALEAPREHESICGDKEGKASQDATGEASIEAPTENACLVTGEVNADISSEPEACSSPFIETTPVMNVNSGNLQADLDSTVQDTVSPWTSKKFASARKSMTHILNDNKENVTANDPLPAAKKIATTESGTPIDAMSMGRLKKELKKKLEKKKSVLKSVSDYFLIPEELKKEN